MMRSRTCGHDLLEDVELAVNDGTGEAASAGSGCGVAAGQGGIVHVAS